MVKKKVRSSKTKELGLFEKFTLKFFDHLKISIFFWISIFLFGLFSYTTFLQREGFPQVSVPISVVRAVYLANDKNSVDTLVTKPILESLDSNDTIEQTTANTTNNASVIVIQHKDDYSSEEGSKSAQDSINKIKDTLPENVDITYESVNATKFNNKYDILISVSSPSRDSEEISKTAEEVASKLLEKPEIVDTQIEELFTEGFNPITNQQEKIQTSFDWSGQRIDNSFSISPSVVIGINLEPGTDIVKFEPELNNLLSEIQNQYKDTDIKISKAAGFAENIKEQTDSLQQNLFEGLIIVVLICFIFIGIRAGLTAAIAMIMTLLMTLGILYLFGITLNTITLFGLVLCLGLIVDDIVIVTESIDTQRKKLSNLREAVTVAIKKIAKASSAGTLTTALGFAPLLFFGGILGKFIKVLPITIIISLFVSLFVSLTFVPLLTRLIHASKDNPNKYSPLTYFRNGVEWLAKLLSSVILSAKSTKRKFVYTFVAILISIGFLMASGPLYSKLKFDIFPTPKDANELQVEFVFGPGTNIDSAIEKTNEANQIITNVLGDDIQKISYQGNANERQATATVTLTPFDEREQTSRQFVNELNKQLTNIDNTRISVSQISAGPPKERLPFVVQINADDPQKANEAAKNLVSFLNDTTINRNNGTEAKVIETEYTGELITLTRIDGKRVVQVRAGFDADDTTAIVQAAQKEVEDNFLSDSSNLAGLSADDFGFDFGVESQNQDSFRSVLLALPVLLLLMYLLLVIQFKSLVQPILILLAVPFSFFGVGLALNTTDNPISFFTMIGFFALIGISVNNTILLTDFANQGRRLGLSPRQAMASALHERLRPLLTTTITSVSALIPLTLSDPFWESLSITLIGGLLSSALLVVIAFPYYYLVLEFLRSRLQLKYKK